MSGGYNPAGYGPTGALALDLTSSAFNFTNVKYKYKYMCFRVCSWVGLWSYQILALNWRFQTICCMKKANSSRWFNNSWFITVPSPWISNTLKSLAWNMLILKIENHIFDILLKLRLNLIPAQRRWRREFHLLNIFLFITSTYFLS